MEETFSSGVFDLFIACGEKQKINLTTCKYLLRLFTESTICQLRYIRLISRSQTLTNLVAHKFDNHTSVVLLPSVDNQASKSVKKTYNN